MPFYKTHMDKNNKKKSTADGYVKATKQDKQKARRSRDAYEPDAPDAPRHGGARRQDGKPYSKNQFSSRPPSGHPSSGHPSSGHPSSGHPSSGRPSSGRPSSGYPSSGGKPAAFRKPGGAKYDDNKSGADGKFTRGEHRGYRQDRAPVDADAIKRGRSLQPQETREAFVRDVTTEAQAENVYEKPENLLVGRNPIREALKAGRDIEKLMVARGDLSGSAREIISMAHKNNVIVQEVDRVRLDAITNNHQGMIAFASAFEYSTVDAMLELAKSKNQEPFLIILDGVTDPHNLGAVIRSAECLGAHGVIVPERRAVGLTPGAVKASAGAVSFIPVARVTNITREIQSLKKQGLWIYGAHPDGEDISGANISGAAALVVGGEGEGISRLVRENCDLLVSIPMTGNIQSLNASVAAGILMHEIARRRRG